MAAGELLHLPGMFFFIVIARVVFGPALGFVLGYAGAVIAVTLSFVVARQLEAHPVQTTALLRLVLWLAPPLSYALASSNIRVRDHLLGSAIGLAVPVGAVVFLSGYL